MFSWPIRIWKTVFGLGAIGLFAWFCFFWHATFAEVSAPVSSVLNLTDIGTVAASESNCREPQELPVPLPADAEIGPPLAEAGPRDLANEALDRMFQSRIRGPYALSVRDGLNEMVIGTSLLAQGVLESTDPSVGLKSIMTAVPAHLPTFGFISSGYGTRRSPFHGRLVHHNGVDFAVRYGSPVFATAEGVVTYSGWYRGLGRMVMINHGYGIVTKYGHNSGLTVKVGDVVKRGDVIARAGSSGRSTGSHVHYEVWVNGKTIDPSQFMFEVPERDVGQSLHQVAMSPYRFPESAHTLGLAAGGDGGPVLPVRMPSQYDRDGLFPLNFLIVGVFFFLAITMAWTIWPRRTVIGRDLV